MKAIRLFTAVANFFILFKSNKVVLAKEEQSKNLAFNSDWKDREKLTSCSGDRFLALLSCKNMALKKNNYVKYQPSLKKRINLQKGPVSTDKNEKPWVGIHKTSYANF